MSVKQDKSAFEATVKNLLRMPHKPVKAEKDCKASALSDI